MSDSDENSPRGSIPRPCSLTVGDLRKAVTRARKRNHITGPANREQMMLVGEAHAEIDDPRAKRIVTDYLEQSPITVPDLRDMRSKIKSFFHPRASAMKMNDIVTYVYWTTKDLGWTWSELDGLSPKMRQPRGCRKSQPPGKKRVPPDTALGIAKKRKPSQYNLFLKSYIAKHRGDSDDAKEVFKAATVAWGKSKGRRDGAKRGAATRAHKRAAPARERERVERLKQTAREVYAEQGEDPAVARRRSMRIPKKRSGSGMPSMMYSDSDSE
jgi:hypothetical protein